MGDPRKSRKKYSGPGHPWQLARLEEETVYRKEYGFKNKKEIWKSNSLLRTFAGQAKSLVTRTGEQADKERAQLLERLKRMGLLGQEATLPDVLTIAFRDVAERRLQTQVHKKMLAHSVKQARQFITHGHITVGGKTITSPSYLVSVQEEGLLAFHEGSQLADPEHPERSAKKKEPVAAEEPADESAADETTTEDSATEKSVVEDKVEEKTAKKKSAKETSKSTKEKATEEESAAETPKSTKEKVEEPAEAAKA